MPMRCNLGLFIIPFSCPNEAFYVWYNGSSDKLCTFATTYLR